MRKKGRSASVKHGRMIEVIASLTVVTLVFPICAKAEGRARIYVYVQTETPARSWFPVWCDKAVVAKVKRGRFFALNVAPGRHMIREEKGVPVFIDVGSGDESFVRLEWRNGDTGGPALPIWQAVPPSEARQDMTCLTYIDADKALSKSVPEQDPRGPPQLERRSKDEAK